LGFNAAVEDNLDSRPSHHDTEEEHEHDDDINSINIVTDQAFEPTQLLTSLKQAIADQEIYRIKGFVNVPNKPMRMVLQGVGDRLETSYDRLWASDEPRQTRLVFIGQALERSQIESALSL
jgi:cobalamin biosynthesis protein CobW